MEPVWNLCGTYVDHMWEIQTTWWTTCTLKTPLRQNLTRGFRGFRGCSENTGGRGASAHLTHNAYAWLPQLTRLPGNTYKNGVPVKVVASCLPGGMSLTRRLREAYAELTHGLYELSVVFPGLRRHWSKIG